MVWYYKTRVGTFHIRPDAYNRHRWSLWIDDENLGSYDSPDAAADDVYTQHTGWNEWDSLPSVTQPTDLTEWRRAS